MLDCDPESASTIIGGLVRSGCRPDAATYSALISGLCKVGRIEEAWEVVERMVEERCPTTVRCFTSIVLGYCVQGRVKEARDLVGKMESFGCPPDTVMYTILMGALRERGEFDEVGKVLGESVLKGWKPDAVACNVYMSVLCRMGAVDKAFRLVNVMREQGWHPTIETLHILFDCLCRDWRYDSLCKAERVLDWDIDVFFYHTLMSRFCQIGRWKAVLKLWATMLKRGIETLLTFTIVIRTLCKKKMLVEAKYVFYNMGFQADVVAFNTLLLGFNMESVFSEVYQLFSYMVREDVTPNEFTYSIVIDSLCREHKFSEAINCFLGSISNGLYPNLIARPIRWLVKDGKHKEILCLFEEMLRRGFVLDGFIFDSVIRGFCKDGLCRSVDSDTFYLIFDRMLGIR